MFMGGAVAFMVQMGLLNGVELTFGGIAQISILDTARFTTITITRIAGIVPQHSLYV